jgi:hypothetical protein
VINTFKSTIGSTVNEAHPFNVTSSYTFYTLGLYTPFDSATALTRNYNTESVTIQRKNLGDILGAVLSWASILILIVGCLAGPLMDRLLGLLTAESLFHLPPTLHSPSLLRFLIAGLWSGIFPKEDAFVRMIDRLERMKDVGEIVRLQALLSRLAPKAMRRGGQELMAS